MKSTESVDNGKKISKRKTLRKWFADHFIFVWIVSSAIFAFIIHWLFSTPAPNEWIAAKWGAGEILTFVSTVALGLLAVWQNKRFKEENDASQLRMEKLTKDANEISIVHKIIEHESNKLLRLRSKMQIFIDACNTQEAVDDVSDVAQQPSDFMKIYIKIKMDSRDKQIRLATVELLSELKTYPNNDSTRELISLISDYCNSSTEVAKCIRECSDATQAYTIKATKEKEFIQKSSNFIAEREVLLDKTIYGNLSLDEIRGLYCQE